MMMNESYCYLHLIIFNTAKQISIWAKYKKKNDTNKLQTKQSFKGNMKKRKLKESVYKNLSIKFIAITIEMSICFRKGRQSNDVANIGP